VAPTTAHTGNARMRRPARTVRRDRDTEQRILDAAHSVFIRRGTSGARMQEIAREAGVNSALLHYYFKTKEGLSEAVFRRAAKKLFPCVIQIMGSDLEIDEKVAQVVQVELDHLSQTPYLPGYLIGELTHHPARARQLVSAIAGAAPDTLLPTVFDTVRKQIAAQVRAGTMRPVEPEQFMVSLLSLCVFPFAAKPLLMVLLALDQKGFDGFIRRRRSELPAFFLRALRP
jgi:TetR/AcrR family transcriptional regulator